MQETVRRAGRAYQPITGALRSRLRTAVRDPGTLADLRWMAANYVYGLLGLLALPSAHAHGAGVSLLGGV
jgi:hypothetical protein